VSRKLDNAIGLYMDGIRDGNPRAAVSKYSGDRYTQHSTGVRDGVEGFVEFFDEFLSRNPIRDITVIRGWEDGQHVFVHVLQSLNHGETEWITADFYDTDEADKLIEHWDVIAAYSPATSSGHTAIDGPTTVVDLERTDANKALVGRMIEELLMPGADGGKAAEYIAPDYIEHDPEAGGGTTSLATLLTNPDRSLWYHEIVLLVGQGNFVATLCRATEDGREYARVDIFRLDNGLIVEHWDNIEPVPLRDEWANSGKF